MVVFQFSIPFVSCSRQVVLPGYFEGRGYFGFSVSIAKFVCHILPLLDEEIQMKAVSFRLFRPILVHFFLPFYPSDAISHSLIFMFGYGQTQAQRWPSPRQLEAGHDVAMLVGVLYCIYFAFIARSEGRAN